jgi:hypothetical protein
MGTRVRVRLLYLLLGLATAFVVVFNILPAIGSYGTSGALANMPLIGPQQIPTVTVIEDDGFAERWAASEPSDEIVGQRDLFRWADTSDGTKDAVTGLPPVQFWVGDGMKLTFWGLTFVDRLSFALPPLLWAALTLAVIWLLWRIVRTVSTGEVFSAVNARRVTAIGLLIAVGASLLQLATYWLDKGVIARSAAAGVLDVPFSFSFVPLWVGAVIVLLAEVFRQGVRLRTEVEGLV